MKIYHLLHKKDWRVAKKKGFYAPSSLETDGFIHCSTKKQVIPTANRRFKNNKNLMLLAINPQKAKAKTVFEDLKSMGEKHPHIYDKLPIRAVEQTFSLKPKKSGLFEMNW